jgi:hypothetical protein
MPLLSYHHIVASIDKTFPRQADIFMSFACHVAYLLSSVANILLCNVLMCDGQMYSTPLPLGRDKSGPYAIGTGVFLWFECGGRRYVQAHAGRHGR